MNAIGHGSDRHFVFRPVGKQRFKELPAYLPMQAAHTIDCAAPAQCQVGHVETFGRVVGVLAAQGQQIMERYTKFLTGIAAQVLLDQVRTKAVKTRSHCSMSGKQVARPGCRQCDLEGLAGLFHEAQGPFQDSKSCMPFIQMAYFGLNPERTQQPPSTDTEEQFLFKTQFRASAVEFAGNPPVGRVVRRVIAVQ